MQVADTNSLGQVAIGARSPASTRFVTVKGRAAACNIALFGRSALAWDMPASRDTQRGLWFVRLWLDLLSLGGGRRSVIRHHCGQSPSLFLSRGVGGVSDPDPVGLSCAATIKVRTQRQSG